MSNIQNKAIIDDQNLCEISISSNIYMKKKGIKENQEFNQQKVSVPNQNFINKGQQLPQLPSIQKPIMTHKKKSRNLSNQFKNNQISTQRKFAHTTNNFESCQKENKKQADRKIQSQTELSDEISILHDRVIQLQKNHNLMQQKFVKSIEALSIDLATRDQRNKSMKNQIEIIKKDLAQRRNDISLLMQLIRQTNKYTLIDEYNHCNQSPDMKNIGSPEKEGFKKTGMLYKQKKQLGIPVGRRSPNMKQKKFSKFLNKL